MVLVLVPSGPAEPAGDAPPQLGAGNYPVVLSLAPGQRHTFEMPLTAEAAEEVVVLVYVSDGLGGLDRLLASVRPSEVIDLRPPSDPERRRRDRAYALLAEARARKAFEAGQALGELEADVRRVFTETIEAAAAAANPTSYGLVVRSRPTAVLTTTRRIELLEDAESVRRDLRQAVVALDGVTRELHAKEADLQRARVESNLLELDWLISMVFGSGAPTLLPIPYGLPRPSTSVVTEVEAVRKAVREYGIVITRVAERFPMLAVVARDVVDDTVDEWDDPTELAAVANGMDLNATKPLDDIIRRRIGQACLATRDAGPRLTSNLFAEAEKVVRRAAADPFRTEEIFGTHPLWRYPILVHAALDRLRHGPGSLPHAAATHALRRAAALARTRAEEEARESRALDWACFGFGVAAFVPVVGQAALAATLACSAVQFYRSASSVAEQREEARAFGPFAAELGLEDPDGAGLLVDALMIVAFDVVPASRACGQILGRLVRLTALPRPATLGLADVVANAINLGVMVAAQRAGEAGIEEPP